MPTQFVPTRRSERINMTLIWNLNFSFYIFQCHNIDKQNTRDKVFLLLLFLKRRTPCK